MPFSRLQEYYSQYVCHNVFLSNQLTSMWCFCFGLCANGKTNWFLILEYPSITLSTWTTVGFLVLDFGLCYIFSTTWFFFFLNFLLLNIYNIVYMSFRQNTTILLWLSFKFCIFLFLSLLKIVWYSWCDTMKVGATAIFGA